jgi:hypothetical protein
MWHSVLPERLLRVVVVRRDTKGATNRISNRKSPPVEAFFTTELTLRAHDILKEYRDRWSVEIEIRDTGVFDSLGRAQCHKRQRLIGANTFCLVMAIVRTLWLSDQAQHGTGVNLCRYRSWYRQEGSARST